MRLIPILFLLLLCSCSRLPALTTESLYSAQALWEKSGPPSYRMVVETSGDRMEPSRYEVIVKGKQVSAMSRNGTTLQVGAAMSYSVEELFHVLDQELDLQKNPQRMGAPPGYASYPMASFDPVNGRLLRFQRSVGGTKNSIEIIVPEFEALDP